MAPPKRHLLKEINDLCRRNKDGSFSTQSSRQDILIMAGKQLIKAGYKNLGADSIGKRHIDFLIAEWKSAGLSPATLKNRVAHLRWWCQKINKQNLIPRKNCALGIERRTYIPKTSKAFDLREESLEKIKCEHLRVSLELQAAFGLRREECLKFQPKFAMSSGPEIVQLKGSWTKGGRPREIPVTSEYQRQVLAKALALAGEGSMIPPDKSYKQQKISYDNQTRQAGLSSLHGLRHQYAQNRYFDLTGWPSPLAGGPRKKALTKQQKEIDQRVRMQISAELGHGREQITLVYLGR